jgi:hypothetical protein
VSTALETRYRSLLRILPAAYRAEWEDEMVATFLAASAPPGSEDPEDPEEADFRAEFGRPGWSEVASVVGLAVRLRLPGAGYSGRPVLLGDAVRLVALVGLLVSGAGGAVGTVAHLWLAGKLPGVPLPDLPVPPVGVAPTTAVLLVATALPAYVALVVGRRRAALALASVSAGAMVVVAVADLVAGDPFLPGRWLSLLLDLLVFAALSAHHDDAPPVARRPWLLALPAAIAAVAGVYAATATFTVTWWLVDWPAMSCVAVAVGLAVHLVRRGRPEWSLALAMLGGVVLVQRLVTLPGFVAGSAADQRTAVLVAGLAEVAAVAATGLPVALWARQAWDRLPAFS